MNTSTFRQITKIILTAYLLEFHKIKKKILTAYLVTVHQIKKIIVSVYFKLKTMATTRLRFGRQRQEQQQPTTTITRATRAPNQTARQRNDREQAKARMRERRKDPENLFKENHNRAMRRVKTDESYRPTHIILQNYGITVDEINQIRAKRGWTTIEIDIPPTFTPTPANVIQAEINAKHKLALSRIAEEKRLEIVEENAELKAIQERLKRANRGAIVRVDRENLYSIDTIIHFFRRNPGTSRGSSKVRAETTLATYFGIKTDESGNTSWPGKGGHFFNLFNNWRDGHCSSDIRPCLSEIDDLLDWLKYRQTIWRKATSKLAVLTPLLVALTDFPPLRDQPLAKKTVEKIEDVRSELKPKTQIEANVRRSSETVSQFEDIKQAVYETFQRKNEEPNPNGLIDKAWLYIQMYAECPVRDDLFSLLIVYGDVPAQFTVAVSNNRKDRATKEELESINAGNNIIYVPRDMSKPVKLVLHKYKTFNVYGIHIKTLSLQLSNKIRVYTSQVNGKYLFGKGKMSNYVNKMLTKAGVKKEKSDPDYQPNFNVGSINLLRKSYVTKALKDPSLSEFDREKLALAMKHSPDTSVKYLRETGVKVSNEEKNILEKITYDEDL